MKKVYVYLLDDMAECEIGYILQAFSMEKLLKNGTKEFEVKTVSFNKEPVLTLGGLTIVPDYTISEVILYQKLISTLVQLYFYRVLLLGEVKKIKKYWKKHKNV